MHVDVSSTLVYLWRYILVICYLMSHSSMIFISYCFSMIYFFINTISMSLFFSVGRLEYIWKTVIQINSTVEAPSFRLKSVLIVFTFSVSILLWFLFHLNWINFNNFLNKLHLHKMTLHNYWKLLEHQR